MVETDPSRRALIDRIAVSGTVAAAFITDASGQVLLVKPASRDEWGFVGGWVDRGESPHQGCAREIEEEIGVALPVGDLLVLDWLTETEHVGHSSPDEYFITTVSHKIGAIAIQESTIFIL